MPIKIPNALPSASVLSNENIFIMTEERAGMQDIRPLKIVILNIMPTKIATETQLLRMLSNSPIQVDITLLQTQSYQSTHTSAEHLDTFYKTFDEICDQRFDGMILTGAPVEKLDFDDVKYWDELQVIMNWTVTHVYSTMHICWGAQAALFHHYGIPKHPLEKKLSGIFAHTVNQPHSPLFRGFDDVFYLPHSRHTEVRRADIEKVPALQIVSESPEAGVAIVMTPNGRQIFITGHGEYDADTLKQEYLRDLAKDPSTAVPQHYFPHDDPTQAPLIRWRAHASLLFTNWLNYYVYQDTPYDLAQLTRVGK